MTRLKISSPREQENRSKSEEGFRYLFTTTCAVHIGKSEMRDPYTFYMKHD